VISKLILNGHGLYVNLKILSKKRQISPNLIVVIASALAEIYVIIQELKCIIRVKTLKLVFYASKLGGKEESLLAEKQEF